MTSKCCRKLHRIGFWRKDNTGAIVVVEDDEEAVDDDDDDDDGNEELEGREVENDDGAGDVAMVTISKISTSTEA